VSLEILPLAITMMAGPQIMSAIVFVTHDRAVRVSLMFLAGVLLATVVGVTVMRGVAALLGGAVDLGSGESTAGKVLQIALVLLLVAGSIKNFVKRDTIEPPKWLGSLLAASAVKAFVVGLALISFMPSDLVIMLTVGSNLETHNLPVTAAVPFILATLLVASLPLLFFLLFHRRAVRTMPKVRDWMNSNSWLINIIVYAIFIVLILA
jgi:hypothetical protein